MCVGETDKDHVVTASEVEEAHVSMKDRATGGGRKAADAEMDAGWMYVCLWSAGAPHQCSLSLPLTHTLSLSLFDTALPVSGVFPLTSHLRHCHVFSPTVIPLRLLARL